MGIQGLLPILKEITTQTHIREWAGKTLAVDAYVWLHRGAYGCAQELATGKSTVKYVNYAMHRVRMLKHYGVTPLIVFDGGLLPSKMGTEDEREKRRTDALAKGNAFLAEGKGGQARDAFVKAVDVTPEMAFQLIKALRREGIQYLVAPYEADPQLAYLERQGIVDGVITEDSDLLVFGCQNVLFKLDGDGNCDEVRRRDFARCREYNFSGWTDAEFRQMAILSGCDYVESIPGLGLKTAHKLMRKYKTAEKVIQFVRLEGRHKVPKNYLDEFKRAELTFRHQCVFDPVSKLIVHLEPLPAGVVATDMPFVGAPLEVEYARALATGNIDPISKLPMIDINPHAFSPTKEPYLTSSFKPTKSKASLSKSQVVPVRGAGSLLSFFSVLPAASASKVKMVDSKSVKKIDSKDVKGKGKALEEEEQVVEVASKFFGGAKKGENVRVEAEEAEAEDQFPDDEAYPGEEDRRADQEDLDAEAELDDLMDLDDPPSPIAADDVPSLPAKREASIISSYAGISSPAATPPRQRRRIEDVDEEDARTDDGISSPSEKTLFAESMSSPGPTPIKEERREGGVKREREESISSDLIDAWSEPITPDEDEVECTPRGKKGKGGGKEGTPAQRIKKEKRAKEEEDEDEPAEAVVSVAANWRAKFMAPSSSIKTPRQALSSARRSLPTPSTTSLLPKSSSSRPLPARKPSALKPLSSTPTGSAFYRAPLSPKTNNLATRLMVLVPSSSPPTKGGQAPPSSSAQREPVVVTNPRLLAFKFGGARPGGA